jgi:hypothetical protein
MMTSRSLVFGAAALACAAALCAFPASAANDKTLQNMKGSVTYGAAGKQAQLAPEATAVLNDADFATTGVASLATIGLPDSSRVLIGANSNVQLATFDQVAGTNAKFVMVGKVRFVVQHPAGAKADYIFQTPTGNVAIRGTEGDIDASPDGGITVNVYELCDPSTPVTVTTSNGQKFALVAGQSLVAKLVNGIVQAKVEQLTQGLIDQFSPDFGVPTSWDAAKGEIVSAAQNQASGAIDNATGGYGSQVTSAVSSIFGHKKSTPTPSPSPGSSSCTH